MKAYQIVIKGNEVSEEYARISRESFQPLVDKGILEIITFDAITPESPDFEEHANKYRWESSLMLADLKGKNPDDHSPTEKAGMCSHWELIRRQSESDERFLIMEHDTYLLPEHHDLFVELIDIINTEDTHYGNIGLFMGCYTLSKHCAGWMYEVLTGTGQFGKNRFPINCGPYCTMHRLFSTYTSHYLKPNNFDNVGENLSTTIHPWHMCTTLYFGRKSEIPFNKRDPDPDNNPWKNPTTQVVSKSMNVTQHHHGYKEEFQEQAWKRWHSFHVID